MIGEQITPSVVKNTRNQQTRGNSRDGADGREGDRNEAVLIPPRNLAKLIQKLRDRWLTLPVESGIAADRDADRRHFLEKRQREWTIVLFLIKLVDRLIAVSYVQ